jgi:hypothetical protein
VPGGSTLLRGVGLVRDAGEGLHRRLHSDDLVQLTEHQGGVGTNGLLLVWVLGEQLDRAAESTDRRDHGRDRVTGPELRARRPRPGYRRAPRLVDRGGDPPGTHPVAGAARGEPPPEQLPHDRRRVTHALIGGAADVEAASAHSRNRSRPSGGAQQRCPSHPSLGVVQDELTRTVAVTSSACRGRRSAGTSHLLDGQLAHRDRPARRGQPEGAPRRRSRRAPHPGPRPGAHPDRHRGYRAGLVPRRARHRRGRHHGGRAAQPHLRGSQQGRGRADRLADRPLWASPGSPGFTNSFCTCYGGADTPWFIPQFIPHGGVGSRVVFRRGRRAGTWSG